MGFFDSVASTVFNIATSAYNTVVRPVTTAASSVVRTVSQPIVQGSYSTGATEQVAVQPKPPIVTAVSNRPVTPSPGTTVTPQTTPSGQQVYVTSRASPVQPKPIEVTRPVQVQAPSIAESIGMLAPGAGLVGVAQFISGDRKVVQNAIMDIPGTGTFVTGAPTLAGYRQASLERQQIEAQSRIEQHKRQVEQLRFESTAQNLQNEQRILGYNQREQALRREVSEFNALGPATSIEEYNTRLSTANLLNTKIQGLQAEGSQINADILAGNRNLYKKQIGLLNESDAINRDLVNLNVASANLGTTGIGGLESGYNRIVGPYETILKPYMPEPEAIQPVLSAVSFVNPITAPGKVFDTAASFIGIKTISPATIQESYISDVYTGVREKFATTAILTGVGMGMGGFARVLGPGSEAAIVAASGPKATLVTKATGLTIKHAGTAMGVIYGIDVGARAVFSPDPIRELVRIGAQEVTPMIGGAMLGSKLPEIAAGARKIVGTGVSGFESRIKAGEIGQIGRQIREIPLTSTEQFDVGLAPSGRGKTLLTQKQLAKARGIASTGEENVIAFDVTTGKEIKLVKVKSTSNKVQWEYPEGIDPTHEVISLHSHPKEITFSRGDMRKFGFDPKVNEIAKGVVTPSGKVHIIEKPLKGGYNADVFVQKWMEDYKPNWLRDIFQPKGRRITTFARTAAEMEMPFRIIEPEQNVVLRATRIGPQKTMKVRSVAPEMEPRLFDIEETIKIDWATGKFEPFTSRIGTGKPTTIKPGGSAKLTETQLLGIQERVYRGKPTTYTARQRGRFPGTSEFIDERGFWSYEQFPSERFLDIQAKTIRRGTPKGVGGITQTPKPVLEELGIGKGWKVTEKSATDALAKWNQPELGPPYSTMSSKFNKPFKAVGRKMKVGTSAEVGERIRLSRELSELRASGWMEMGGEPYLGFEFEPLKTGTGKSIVPTGKKYSKPAPSPGGSKTLSKTFKNAEDMLNPISQKSVSKGGMLEVTAISRPLDTSNVGDYSRAYGRNLDAALVKEKEISKWKSPEKSILQDTSSLYSGIWLGRSELPNALGRVRGGRRYDIEEPSLAGPLSLGGFGIPQISMERQDSALSIGVAPMIANIGAIGSKTMSGTALIPGVFGMSGLNMNLRNVQPAIMQLPAIGQLPNIMVGTAIEPALKVTPIITPDIGIKISPIQMQPQIITNIQAPDLGLKQFQQQINITDLEIPPYTPPSYTFEIPPIPPIIVPGFPMGLGGGGGGGGYGGDRGGYLFEETLKGGGESDPFGIGGMNFDALGMMGIPKGTGSGKRRRRRK